MDNHLIINTPATIDFKNRKHSQSPYFFTIFTIFKIKLSLSSKYVVTSAAHLLKEKQRITTYMII
jgi:hypothetical protein